VASVDATFPGARLTGHATGRIDRATPARVRVGFVDLDLQPLLVRAGPVPEPVGPVRAVVSGSAELSVAFDVPAGARGTVTLDAAQVVAAGETWRAAGPVLLRREPGTTRAERLRLESRAGTISVAGTVGDDGRLALALDGRAPLAPIARWRPEIRESDGVLQASVELGGTFAAPAIKGRGSVRDASLRLRDVPHPVTDVRADLTFTRERLHVSGGRASILGSTISVSGDVVLEPRPLRLDLAVDGDVPLGVLAAFRPEIREARGVARLMVRIGGTVDRPEPSGQATVQADYLSLRDYDEPLRDVRARLTASATRVSLTDGFATVGGGTVRASGGVALQAFTPGPYAFRVEARRVSLEPVRDFATTWDADLEVAGGAGRAQARGEARLIRGAWVSETPLLRLLVERGVPSSPSPDEGVALSIRLVLGDNLLIRTAIARLRVHGTLDLQGTTAAPILFGTADAADGQIIFRKHRFTVTRAAARFVDPRRIDPVLDVQATARIAQYDVRLQVTGRTDSLEVRLASSPPLPEEDVLSLVAFGTTRADLGKGGAGAVVGEVAGLILQDLFGIGSGPGLGPLEVFEMKSTESSGRTLELGKRVGERATVRYSQGLENTAERRLRLEYEVVGPLVIAGEQNFRGGFGGDVLLRLRFR
jgi:autotransporter translocation and assembly factor TamB